MADATRFPNLALPFSIVGASAGWLSVSLLSNPLVGAARSGAGTLATLCGAAAGAAAGMLMRRACVGRRYAYEIEAPDPDARSEGDAAWRHAAALIAAGALTGAVVTPLLGQAEEAYTGATLGALAAIAFVPVGLVVLATARRAQRARLGSLVAGSDRRAVWGILATTLAIATAEALPEWPAAGARQATGPWPALVMIAAAGLVIAGVLVADALALRRARRTIADDLLPQQPELMDTVDQGVPHLDLGLGDDVLARVSRGAAAYRTRERARSLVQGSPERAVATLRRALLRGVAGLCLVGVMGALHAAANTRSARELYGDLRCRQGNAGWCLHLAGVRL